MFSHTHKIFILHEDITLVVLKKLERSVKNRVIAGVIGGLAEYLGVDANLLRIVGVVLLILIPIPMIVLYIVAVFLIPRQGEEKPLAVSFEIEEHLPLLVGLILIMIGAFLLGSISLIPVPWIFNFYNPLIVLQLVAAVVLVIVGLLIALPRLKSM